MALVCGVECPEDIIVLIFEEILDLFTEETTRHRCNRLLTLTHVCRGWRNAALGVSSLWSVLAYHDDPLVVREWLRRSRTSPLTLHFDDMPLTRIGVYSLELAPHVERITELSLPNTKLLSRISRTVNGHVALKLTKLSLETYRRGGTSSKLDFLCPQLTHLTVRDDNSLYKSWSLPPSVRHLIVWSQIGEPDDIRLPVSRILTVLRQVPDLESWTWDLRHSVEISVGRPEVVTLPKLRNLALIGFHPEELQILLALSFPALHCMDLEITLETPQVDEVQSQLSDVFDILSPHLASLNSAEPKFDALAVEVVLNWEDGMGVMFDLHRPHSANEQDKHKGSNKSLSSSNSLRIKFEEITMPDPDWERFEINHGPVNAPWLTSLPRHLFDALPSLAHSVRTLRINLDCEYFVRHHQFPYFPAEIYARLRGLETIYFMTTCCEERLDSTATGTHEAFSAMVTWVEGDQSRCCTLPNLRSVVYTRHQFTTKNIREIARALKSRRSCGVPRITITFDDCVLDNMSEDVRQKMLNILRKYATIVDADQLRPWCTTSTDDSSGSESEEIVEMFRKLAVQT
ncbi:hypothetical protein BDY19DRAFT_202485 [Irpex rosettiformis]|uniref:Uncharacterized protein n=1 Tax=Irpex rosettiformis TaxID=378272 RepID=A0ACB8U0U1_9APHY|nr:hypothetical protein BDY19DRAFT_202485 [Irpex rosettiformis]